MALQNLKQDKSTVVLKTDKGKATVILDAEDYFTKLLAILADKAFKKLKPTLQEKIESLATKLLKATDSILSNCHKLAD